MAEGSCSKHDGKSAGKCIGSDERFYPYKNVIQNVGYRGGGIKYNYNRWAQKSEVQATK